MHTSTTPTKEMLTECILFRWIRTSEICFSMKLYTVACDVAYNIVDGDKEIVDDRAICVLSAEDHMATCQAYLLPNTIFFLNCRA